MKPLTYHPKASDEIDQAFGWYAMRSARAADGFYEQYFAAVKKVGRQPSRSSPYLHGTQRIILDRYPFSIIFRELPRKIEIVAVAHAKRKPGYWAKRL